MYLKYQNLFRNKYCMLQIGNKWSYLNTSSFFHIPKYDSDFIFLSHEEKSYSISPVEKWADKNKQVSDISRIRESILLYIRKIIFFFHRIQSNLVKNEFVRKLCKILNIVKEEKVFEWKLPHIAVANIFSLLWKVKLFDFFSFRIIVYFPIIMATFKK